MAIHEANSTSPPGDEAARELAQVRAAAGGDASAYGALYDRYAPLVRAVCYDATGDVAEAQDLAQEVFLRAFVKLSGLRRPQRFAAWLVAVARRVCQEWRRGRARQRRRESALQTAGAAGLASGGGVGPGAENQSAADSLADADEVRRLHAAMLRLPEKERLAVQAFYLLGESAERAGAAAGLSRSGLYRVLDRARKRLRRLLEGASDDG